MSMFFIFANVVSRIPFVEASSNESIRVSITPNPSIANTNTFEQMVAQGLLYMSHRVGTADYQLITVYTKAWPDGKIARQASDLTFIQMAMSPSPTDDAYIIANRDIEPDEERWTGPFVSPGREGYPNLQLWNWKERGRISLAHAMELLARFGQVGPWISVIFDLPQDEPMSRRLATEPFYSFERSQRTGGGHFWWGRGRGRWCPLYHKK